LHRGHLRPLFSCVAESHDTHIRKVEALVMSLRTFGGSLADAPFVANVVGELAAEKTRRLQELSAEVRVVERFDERNALANKLRMLELAERGDFDVLVALDCDVVVVGDIAPWLSEERLGAKSADYDYASPAEWRRLLEQLCIRVPDQTAIATASGRTMIPYFNSGVLFVPQRLCAGLLSAWTQCLDEVLALAKGDPHIIPFPSLSEQVALTCAIHRADIPYELLPVGLNFPTHAPVHRRVLLEGTEVRILHYHADVDEAGFLYRATCAVADPYIDEYNRSYAAQVETAYAGLRARPWRTSARRTLERRLRLTSLRGRRTWHAIRGAGSARRGPSPV
jgi:hypothetical protein